MSAATPAIDEVKAVAGKFATSRCTTNTNGPRCVGVFSHQDAPRQSTPMQTIASNNTRGTTEPIRVVQQSVCKSGSA